MGEQTGFPALAQKISGFPAYEGFIFRKFDRLSARNLLHLESRLAYLEWKLDQADEQAAVSQDNETRRSIKSWEAFEERSENPKTPEHRRMAIADEIRETLKEYQEAMLRQHQVAGLRSPAKRALDVVCKESYNEVHDSCTGNMKARPILTGLAGKRLEESNHRDLAAIRQPVAKDLLSRFLQNHWVFKTTRLSDRVEYAEERYVSWVATTVSTMAATILLIGAILSLRFVKQEDAQVGMIVAFTVLFAAGLAVLTTARRAEIFGSSAAVVTVIITIVLILIITVGRFSAGGIDLTIRRRVQINEERSLYAFSGE